MATWESLKGLPVCDWLLLNSFWSADGCQSWNWTSKSHSQWFSAPQPYYISPWQQRLVNCEEWSTHLTSLQRQDGRRKLWQNLLNLSSHTWQRRRCSDCPMSISPTNLLLSSQEAILIVSNHKVTLGNHVDNYTKTKESQIFHLLESFVMILTKVGLSFPSLTWK